MSRVQKLAEEMISQHGFLGVPVETFEQAGREQLIALLGEGLNPESEILEIGCGCLRIAYWLVRFLDPGCYHGIEPARQRVEYGLRYLFTPEEVTLKEPRFDFNPRFDSSVFGARFDFFLARSIWTHASKPQIAAMLDSFIRDSNPSSIFLTSYLPARSSEEDYKGNDWIGTSHESDTPGVIKHSLTWIVEQCKRRALKVEELSGMDCDSQFWLRIRHE
ncbi:MAG TPA: class I SAM-dependent methyltransferase [Blastocatellia bacterium]|nr:class I SAM-dependent methyltransferase [Blastocatellia bacterium]